MVNEVRKFQPGAGATIFTVVSIVILLALGYWQLQRLAWKTALLERLDRQIAAPAIPLPKTVSDPAALEFQPVTLHGYYDSKHIFLVKPRTMDSVAGYYLYVFFHRDDGGVVLVNRGFIDAPHLKKIGWPLLPDKITGIVELPHKNYFTPENNPAKNDWYWPDVRAMADSIGLQQDVPMINVTLSSRDDGSYPRSLPVRPDIPNNHLQYAIFWFSMALVLLGVYGIARFRK